MVFLRARFITHAFLVGLIYAVICHEDLKASLLQGYCLSTVGQYRTYLNIVSVPSPKVESKNVKACKPGRCLIWYCLTERFHYYIFLYCIDHRDVILPTKSKPGHFTLTRAIHFFYCSRALTSSVLYHTTEARKRNLFVLNNKNKFK